MEAMSTTERRPLLYDSSSFVMQRRRIPPTKWWQWAIGVLSVTCVCSSLVIVTIRGMRVPERVTIEVDEKPKMEGTDTPNLKMSFNPMGKGSLPAYLQNFKPDKKDTPDKPDWPDKDTPDKPDWPDKDTPDKPDWPDKDTPDKPDWPDKDTPDKPDWPDKDTPDKPDWPDKDTPDKPDWPDKDTPDKHDVSKYFKDYMSSVLYATQDPKATEKSAKKPTETEKKYAIARQKINAKWASKYLFGLEPPIVVPGDDKEKTDQAFADFNIKVQEKFAKAYLDGTLPKSMDTSDKPLLKSTASENSSLVDPASYVKIHQELNAKYALLKQQIALKYALLKQQMALKYAMLRQKMNAEWAAKYMFDTEPSKIVPADKTDKNPPSDFASLVDPTSYVKHNKDINDKFAKAFMKATNGKAVTGESQSSTTGGEYNAQKKYADMNKAMNEKYFKAFTGGSLLESKTPGSLKESYADYNMKINQKFAKSFMGGSTLPDTKPDGSSYADYNAKINAQFASKFTGGLLKSTGQEEPSDPTSSYFQEHRKMNNKFRKANGGVTIPDVKTSQFAESAKTYSEYAKQYIPKMSNPGNAAIPPKERDEVKEGIDKIYADAREKMENLLVEKLKPFYKKHGGVENTGDSGDKIMDEATMSMFERAMEHGNRKLEKRMVVEENLREKGIELQEPSGAASHQRFLSCQPRAWKLAKKAVVKEGATELLKQELNLLNNEVEKFLPHLEKMGQSFFNVEDGTEDGRCWKEKPYRIADGACNNVDNPTWGASFSPYKRLIPAEYADGISVPRLGSSGQPLPSARQISATLFNEQKKGDSKASLFSALWGLFVDHDLTNTASSKSSDGKPITCCHKEVLQNSSYQHPECMAIFVSKVDRFFGPLNVSCQEFVRSAPANYKRLGPRDQMNQITSYFDGSAIYGSSEDAQHALRSHNNGSLKISYINGMHLLPTKNDPLSTCGKPQIKLNCFKSGDVRVNEQVELMAVHTLFHREHNRVAEKLAEVNPSWNDERLFQEAKRIVVAELQHATYNEYLPLLLGKKHVKKYGLELTNGGTYYDGYDPYTDVTISNVFTAAAYRFGHTQIKSFIELADKSYKVVENITLRETFFNPETIYKRGLDPHIRGMIAESANTVDNYVSEELRNHLFEPKGQKSGIDLTSITVQRGRDHGLPAYPRWREYCNLSSVRTWTDMEAIAGKEKAKMFRNTYDDVNDIDFVVGAVSEAKVTGGILGPTHSCLIAEQFSRLRRGDRYWYENMDPAPFTKEQLKELKKTTVARLLCDNSEHLEYVSKKPLEILSQKNPLIKCIDSSIPVINFGKWFEDPRNPLPSSQYKP